MEITLKKKEEEIDQLPASEPEDVKSSIEEEKRRLEIENAELRGFKKATESVKPSSSSPSPQSAHEQTKARVYADVNGMDDEKFKEIYRMDKSQAMMALLDRDNQISKAESLKASAESEAKVEMATKYGADFYKYKNEVEEAVSELSDEVRSNPSKLAKAMERIYIALQKSSPAKAKEDQRKKMIADFEKPTPSVPVDKKPDNQEIPEQFKPLSKIFGIQSEKERQELMQQVKNGEYVPMNMGNGIWFKHPAKGFERVEQKA